MSKITIPPEAFTAARDAFYEAEARRKSTDDAMRAACIAMLKAWPGVRLGKYRDVAGPNDRIILPLPQESTNAES